MTVAIFEKRYDCYAHPCKDEYKRRKRGLFIVRIRMRTTKVQNITLEDEPL